MNRYKRNLKKIQKELSHTTRNNILLSKIKINEEDIFFLESKGLVKTTSFYDGDFGIELTNKGVTFFEDNKEKFKEKLVWSILCPILVSIITSIIISKIL